MSLTIHDCDALLALGRELEAGDYRFTTVTPATHQRVNARSGNAWAACLRDIFGWSRPFRDGVLAPQILALLQRAGAVEAQAEGWRATVRASTLGELLFFHSAYPTIQEDAVFFGPDTCRFVAAIEPALESLAAPPLRVADIGCGAGPAAIRIALRFPEAEVFAVDINEAALTLTAVNARLAGAPNLIPCNSNLLAALPGEFDLIVSNPPYLLDAGERAYRHGGGKRGAGLSLAIVDAALARLRAGGSLLLYTGVAIVGGKDEFLNAIAARLDDHCDDWRYKELDPDVFGEELAEPGYSEVERIAAVWLHAVKRCAAAPLDQDRAAGATMGSA
jgi:methylase of polypeptide subunit release factors